MRQLHHGPALISIHAPSRERLVRGYPLAKWQRFQSTLPRGSDHPPAFSFAQKLISIHAPSRERPRLRLKSDGQRNFNPRSLAGATTFRDRWRGGHNPFQSTLPRGSDTLVWYTDYLSGDFNPRSLAGATGTTIHRAFKVPLFQSTLPRGSDC